MKYKALLKKVSSGQYDLEELAVLLKNAERGVKVGNRDARQIVDACSAAISKGMRVAKENAALSELRSSKKEATKNSILKNVKDGLVEREKYRARIAKEREKYIARIAKEMEDSMEKDRKESARSSSEIEKIIQPIREWFEALEEIFDYKDSWEDHRRLMGQAIELYTWPHERDKTTGHYIRVDINEFYFQEDDFGAAFRNTTRLDFDLWDGDRKEPIFQVMLATIEYPLSIDSLSDGGGDETQALAWDSGHRWLSWHDNGPPISSESEHIEYCANEEEVFKLLRDQLVIFVELSNSKKVRELFRE